MGNETIPSLPSVSSPNSTDLVPIEHGAAGGPYTTSQTTIAELVAAGGGGGGGGGGYPGFAAVETFSFPAGSASNLTASSNSFTPTVEQKYTLIADQSISSNIYLVASLGWGSPVGNNRFGIQYDTNGRDGFTYALASGTEVGSSSTTALSSQGNGGTRVIGMEFVIHSGNTVDFRGWCDGEFVGAAFEFSIPGISGQALSAFIYNQPIVNSYTLYPGWLFTEPGNVLAAAFA